MYVASWVIARFFTASQAVVQSFVVGRGYECLALPFLFARLTGMSSGGRVLIPQGNPINNIMADSYVRARLVARRLRESALRMFRGITNKIIGADDEAQ